MDFPEDISNLRSQVDQTRIPVLFVKTFDASGVDWQTIEYPEDIECDAIEIRIEDTLGRIAVVGRTSIHDETAEAAEQDSYAQKRGKSKLARFLLLRR